MEQQGPVTARPRISRPNYNQIHARPLPLEIYALPPLIPHNPLSLLHIAYTYISQLIFSTRSQPCPLHVGYFDPATRSVHITDERAIRVFWEQGFFGKGNLSRSEPTWLEREKRRRGILVGETSEEITRRRREERKEFKKERARKEREEIERKLKEEAPSVDRGTQQDLLPSVNDIGHTGNTVAPDLAVIEDVHSLVPDEGSALHEPLNEEIEKIQSILYPDLEAPKAEVEISNEEHLQLTLEEAFFLSYGLGVLQIVEPLTSVPIPTWDMLTLARQFSSFSPKPIADLSPDDPFLTSYVAYHHFRSLGWVVRPGIKFAVNWLLYNRGPVFSHAEFAVIVLPSYRNEYWSRDGRREQTRKKECKSWWWLHCANRVQSQVA